MASSTASGKNDDPAFLYFPTNYRWSMGLLICLSGAPWMGAEIDEVNRVGRALARQGRRRRRLVQRMGPDGRQGRGARPRRRCAQATSSRRPHVSCARRATTRPASASSSRARRRAWTSMRSRCDLPGSRRPDAPPAHRAGRDPLREDHACRACWCIPIRKAPAKTPRPPWCSSTASTSPRRLQYGYGIPDLAARGIGCLIVDGPGNGESVRFRNLPLIAETEHYATPVYEYLAGAQRVRPQADRRHGAVARRLLRAARRRARTALCLLRRLGRAVGLSRHLGAAARSAGFGQGAVAVGAARASAMGARRRQTAPQR